MEAANQNTSEPNDIADEPNENEATVEETSSTATKSEPMITEDTNRNEQAGTSSECQGIDPVVEKPAAKRNYRRRTGDSDDSSSEDSAIADQASAVDNANEVQEQPQSSDSEDVSLDELRVSASDDDNNHNDGR